MNIPSEQQRHAMKPTPLVLFFRTFFLYQMLRFVWINLRMLKMIWMSHRGGREVAGARVRAARVEEPAPALSGKS